ncbi:MAG: DUF4435 domain-containing protein, partial [Clostridiales bacterium]|nr:DUF4435 domain-containing protein [Clostridiales bacterium]
MRIYIPSLNGETTYVDEKHSIVLIGANGSGKTRMSIWIDEHNQNLNVHRISAQKSLNIPDFVQPTSIDKAEEKFIYGANNNNKQWLEKEGKRINRWGNAPEVHLLNDVQQLMEYLMAEYCEKSIEFRREHLDGNNEFSNQTKLEVIQSIWEDVVRHRKLQISTGKIEALEDKTILVTHKYNASGMSDGERAIFYYIGEVLCAKENSLIIIDEPENHLHKSILIRLWNAIETSRPDCTFLYITHSLDFATSRLNTQVIWVKSMHEGPIWEYELLDENSYSDALMLEILGNRQKVLLVEGASEHSIDRKLYSQLFQEYNIIPLEGCATVIQSAKAFNTNPSLHYTEVKAIVDRDRRDDAEITSLAEYKITVPKVAEIENLFLLPGVIRIVAQKQTIDNVEQIIMMVKEKTIDFLQQHLEEQALLFVRQKMNNRINQLCNLHVTTIDDLSEKISVIPQEININAIYEDVI